MFQKNLYCIFVIHQSVFNTCYTQSGLQVPPIPIVVRKRECNSFTARTSQKILEIKIKHL